MKYKITFSPIYDTYVDHVFFLPENYVPKPFLLDLMQAKNETEYQVLKKIKKAKYIEAELLKQSLTADDFIKKVLTGIYSIEDGFIRDSLSRKPDFISRELNGDRIFARAQYDLYGIGDKADAGALKSINVKILATEEVLRFPQFGRFEILPFDIPSDRIRREEIAEGDRFRLGYQSQTNEQVIKAGSTFLNLKGEAYES